MVNNLGACQSKQPIFRSCNASGHVSLGSCPQETQRITRAFHKVNKLWAVFKQSISPDLQLKRSLFFFISGIQRPSLLLLVKSLIVYSLPVLTLDKSSLKMPTNMWEGGWWKLCKRLWPVGVLVRITGRDKSCKWFDPGLGRLQRAMNIPCYFLFSTVRQRAPGKSQSMGLQRVAHCWSGLSMHALMFFQGMMMKNESAIL